MSGYTIVHVVAAVAVILLVAGAGVSFFASRSRPDQKAEIASTEQRQTKPHDRANSQTDMAASTASSEQSGWMMREDGWQHSGELPDCPNPFVMREPTDLNAVTSVLYPGQTRGGIYKPHGGLRFDNAADNKIAVYAPFNGQLVQAGRYLVDGETQYTFDVIHPCGFMFRLGHLLELPANLQSIAAKLPPAKEGDSRTEMIDPPVAISQGDVMGVAVGVKKNKNVFFDLGVFDLRQKNRAATNAEWASSHDPLLSHHALCWFDLLPGASRDKLKQLPAGDGQSGKTSDFC